MAEEQKATNTAKRHSILQDLSAQLRSKAITSDVQVLGKTFKLKGPLSEDEEVWAESRTRAESIAAYNTSNNDARLAASLVSIDGVTVDQLFTYPDSMSKEIRDNLDANSARKRYWLMDQILAFIAEEGSRQFVGKLIDGLRDIDNRLKEVTQEAPKS